MLANSRTAAADLGAANVEFVEAELMAPPSAHLLSGDSDPESGEIEHWLTQV
jgi:hypothetical protein